MRARSEPKISAGDLDARRQPLHIPVDRARQRLIEVIETEDQRTLRSLEQAEVQQMGVTAELCCQPAARRPCEVGSHDRRRASVERE